MAKSLKVITEWADGFVHEYVLNQVSKESAVRENERLSRFHMMVSYSIICSETGEVLYSKEKPQQKQ